MLKASSEERGTVAGLASLSKDLEDAHQDGRISIWVSNIFAKDGV